VVAPKSPDVESKAMKGPPSKIKSEPTIRITLENLDQALAILRQVLEETRA
jgi:hypothetical protein